jgi:flagellar motor switch protein FliM
MGQGPAYDFSSPECLGPRQLQWLRTLHEGLARDFGVALSALLRTPVDVSLAGVDHRTYGEFLDHLDTPACFYVLKAAALDERLMLEIEPSILYPMIDRLLGGGGKGDRSDWPATNASRRCPPAANRPCSARCPSVPGLTQTKPVPFSSPGRPLSKIEVRLAARIARLFLAELHRAWKDTFDLKLDIMQVESNPRLLRVLPSDEMVVLVGFELTLADLRGMMRLCLPCRAIQRIGDGGKGDRSNALVEVEVTLAETQIAAAELADLRIGDIITTETAVGSPAVLSIAGDGQKFHAKPGVYQGRKAVCITEPIKPPTEN